MDIGTTAEKEVMTLGNFYLWRGSSCSGTRMGPLKQPMLDYLPATSIKMKARTGRRYWRILRGNGNQLWASAERGEAKGAWESQMSANGHPIAVI